MSVAEPASVSVAALEVEPEPEVVDLSGTWSGRAGGRAFTLQLSQHGASVSGTLKVALGTGWRSFSVRGSVSDGSLSLSGGKQVALSGRFSGGRIVSGYLRIGRQEDRGWVASR